MSGQVEGVPVVESMAAGPREPVPTRSRSKGPRYLVLLIVLLLTAAGAVGIAIRLGERRALAKETEVLAVPSVVVIHPKVEAAQQ